MKTADNAQSFFTIGCLVSCFLSLASKVIFVLPGSDHGLFSLFAYDCPKSLLPPVHTGSPSILDPERPPQSKGNYMLYSYAFIASYFIYLLFICYRSLYVCYILDIFVAVYFILSRLLYLAYSANLGLRCMPHPGMGPLV